MTAANDPLALPDTHFQELVQQRWDDACKVKGYTPRGGMETRYTEDLTPYYLLPRFGRVRFEPQFGWVVVVSTWDIEMEVVYQYIKTDEALLADPLRNTRETSQR